jgi:hypothetical protein
MSAEIMEEGTDVKSIFTNDFNELKPTLVKMVADGVKDGVPGVEYNSDLHEGSYHCACFIINPKQRLDVTEDCWNQVIGSMIKTIKHFRSPKFGSLDFLVKFGEGEVSVIMLVTFRCARADNDGESIDTSVMNMEILDVKSD